MTIDLLTLHIFVVITAALVHIPFAVMGEIKHRNRFHPRKNPTLPFFRPTPTNVTFTKGQEAVLQCAVENLGTKTIVWRRASDPNPITIGEKTFITDRRFRVVHQDHSLTWNLHISRLKKEDSGVYECQVSMKKLKIRQNIRLTVDESTEYKHFKPEIKINGTFYVEKGETLKLICNATGSDYPPDAIDWFKDGDKIKSNGRVTLTNDVSLADSTIISTLAILRGHMADAGTYVCRTSDLQVTSAKVIMLNTGTNNEKRVPFVADNTGATSSTSFSQHGNKNTGSQAQQPPRQTTVLVITLFALMWLWLPHTSIS
ncbi:roundabout-like protein 1 [Plakobranchus ocellatus]|uniref:Roundabout-like protein 1 n=1 Tax=Plakobranchus ocellatus TaxID=259542 RepID=A0AAV3YMD7_9GAST|nr:roundabout-like protein 1 [Plakobranchus ocellatus]